MTKPVLAYWEIRCLAEPIRLMLEYLGVDFTDKRYPTGDGPTYARPEWARDKLSLGLDFPNLPYWIDGDVKLTESWAIMRHIARKNKRLYPQNDDEHLRCDMLHNSIETFRYNFINMCYTKTTELFEAEKDKFLANLPSNLDMYEKFLGSNCWLIGDQLTFVDFAFCEALDQIQMFKPNFLAQHKVLQNYLSRFDSLEGIESYRRSSRYHALPINSKYAYWGGQNVIGSTY